MKEPDVFTEKVFAKQFYTNPKRLAEMKQERERRLRK
jgi:hypothetical protein